MKKYLIIRNYSDFFIINLLIGLLIILIPTFSLAQNIELKIFVSPSGKDNNSGSQSYPFYSIEKAQMYVKSELKKKNYSKVTIYLRGGFYYLTKTLLFIDNDCNPNETTVEYRNYLNEVPIISGGILLPSKWVKVNDKNNIWSLQSPRKIKDITQLFCNDQRLKRSTSSVYYTDGPLPRYKIMIEKMGAYNFNFIQKLKQKDLLPFCSFNYRSQDLNYLNSDDLEDIEMSLYHSWETSWHEISKIDKVGHSVFLKSPSHYPVGFFSNSNKYIIENSKKDLKEYGDWCYSKKNNELLFKSKNGENPNNLKFITPQLSQILIIRGNKRIKCKTKNLVFTGIEFEHSISPRGINIDKKLANVANLVNVPNLNWETGFSGNQAAYDCGQSIILESSENINFRKCKFKNLGNYAISIDKYSSNNLIEDCEFNNIGGGGIILGYYKTDPLSIGIPPSATGNNIKNCKIHDFGIIYTSSVGIGLMNANHSYIFNNEIYNSNYSGISSGWVWGSGASFTFDNVFENNDIHNVMRLLADGAGIYTLGSQPNTIIKGNTIHDIYRSKDAIGSKNNGIFFDEGSSGMFIDGNSIYNIESEKLRYNKCNPNNMKWGFNNFK